ncbi:tRNA methyltransferase, has a role in tRNA modification [Elasticomyces elasticus]|uniref:tRNA methyltransferase, has a role in tRNA modification n=1 Tax=Exophiala sideris TaxID=1016849 RepID=A0ABR0JGI3_9EURO|nr:tRNA methyltransferase, has a role in tRNA modification [Elasticomyces elasticus]KAK5033277.1 tRNA methyltransferase, has a role in tRNA modification [Exophiala sideris]KAK5042226.1 tRNA methyltransferase, has a role in tRNA modification [Exophiala sideris]KAK5063821.1 tRNA methyltransferase, has a role in tRNA modification [Exophiala sideris]KAK5185494.1 tRNA methyltransferase, has a role in tRNA modification [Eurotiomycetes sp. CCFEE 6388]
MANAKIDNADTDVEPRKYEEKHVHAVYEEIATHFSETRYKPWPVVDEFLKALPAGAVGLDIGCGNGKYLSVNKDVFIVASDRSRALVEIARQRQPHSAVVADTLSLPHPRGVFDFAISIAVIHHLSSRDRRIDAIRVILETLRPPSKGNEGGQALIFVWALEQKNSRRGWDRGDQQDQLVPWVLKPMHNTKPDSAPTTYHRYYHLYHEGELENDAETAGSRIVKSGYDRDNWWIIIARQK